MVQRMMTLRRALVLLVVAPEGLPCIVTVVDAIVDDDAVDSKS